MSWYSLLPWTLSSTQNAVMPFGEQVSHRQEASAVRSISLTDYLHTLNILLLGACKNIQKRSFSIKTLPVLGFNSHRPSFLKYKFMSYPPVSLHC